MISKNEGNRVIVVTGACGALGEAIVERFVRYGDQVVGWDIDAPGPGSIVTDERKRTMHWMHVDVTDAGAVDDAMTTVEQEVGPVDAIIHGAGGFRWSHMDTIETDDIDFLVDLNLRSSLYVARAAMTAMKPRGKGRLIFMSSRSTLKPGAGEGAYAATKAGLNALTAALADEVKDSEITVNALQPSVIDTAANREAMADADFESWVPRGELVDLMEYLISEKARSINGSAIPVTGRT